MHRLTNIVEQGDERTQFYSPVQVVIEQTFKILDKVFLRVMLPGLE